MKPLVSGAEAKRYIAPQTDTWLLFPYRVDVGGPSLIPAGAMAAGFPLAWAYLRGHEAALRARENGKMNNDEDWWAYNYPKNLDKQETQKLIVPRLVAHIGCSVDADATQYLDNVDVGGVGAARGVSPFFLAAVINAPPADFAFRLISKPFRGDYRSANKQFIAPLPIPDAPEADRAALAQDAERLQTLHSTRRDLLSDTARRLSVLQVRPRPDAWLFPDLPRIEDLTADAPRRLVGSDRRDWARTRLLSELKARHDALGEHLRPGVALSADLQRGELRFVIDGIPAVGGIFPPAAEAAFVLAQWRVIASRIEVTNRIDGKRLAAELTKVSLTAEPHMMAGIVALQEQMTAVDAEIAMTEARVNATIYRLHHLTPAEIALIAGDRR